MTSLLLSAKRLPDGRVVLVGKDGKELPMQVVPLELRDTFIESQIPVLFDTPENVADQTRRQRHIDRHKRAIIERHQAMLSTASVDVSAAVVELPDDVWLFIACGEGTWDFKVCKTRNDVRAAYVASFCGSDDDEHAEEIDGMMSDFDDDDNWSGHGRYFHQDLYCSDLTIYKIPSAALLSIAAIDAMQEKVKK